MISAPNFTRKIVFNVEPVAKPRMTRSDAWKKRKVVGNYWAFKHSIKLQANAKGFKLPEIYGVIFYMSYPKSEPKKNREENKPHIKRPDLDNFLKALNDCLCEEDSQIHTFVAKKRYTVKEPRIEIYY